MAVVSYHAARTLGTEEDNLLEARSVRQRLAEPAEVGSVGSTRDTAIDLDGGEQECSFHVDMPQCEAVGDVAEVRPWWLPRPSARGERQMAVLRQSLRAAADGGAEPTATAPPFDPELGWAPPFSVGANGVVLDGQREVCWPWECSEACMVTPPSAWGRTAYTIGMARPSGMSPPEDVVAKHHFATPSPLNFDSLGAHEADATVLSGLRASTSDGRGGANSTGVRAYKLFCGKYNRAVLRPVDPNAPLWVKLSEEVWAMRFVSELIDDRTIAVDTARSYFGAASSWHLRETGIGFAAGMCMRRLGEMVKGLKKLRDGPPSQLRRGISPAQLRDGMDLVFPPVSAENVNIRAMLAVGLQGLMRGRELGCEGRFNHELDLARGDLATCSASRLAFFMRPAKPVEARPSRS